MSPDSFWHTEQFCHIFTPVDQLLCSILHKNGPTTYNEHITVYNIMEFVCAGWLHEVQWVLCTAFWSMDMAGVYACLFEAVCDVTTVPSHLNNPHMRQPGWRWVWAGRASLGGRPSSLVIGGCWPMRREVTGRTPSCYLAGRTPSCYLAGRTPSPHRAHSRYLLHRAANSACCQTLTLAQGGQQQFRGVLGHWCTAAIDRTTFHACQWCRKTVVLVVISRGPGLIWQVKAFNDQQCQFEQREQIKLL